MELRIDYTANVLVQDDLYGQFLDEAKNFEYLLKEWSKIISLIDDWYRCLEPRYLYSGKTSFQSYLCP